MKRTYFLRGSFAQAVCIWRAARSLSLRDVADKTGVSASTLSRIEQGKFTPDLETYLAVCSWLGLSPAAFSTLSQAITVTSASTDTRLPLEVVEWR